MVCSLCGTPASAGLEAWRCACGGPFDLPPRALDPAWRPASGAGVWRYDGWIGEEGRISLGEPATGLIPFSWRGLDLVLKLEGELPTGSFKDRGSAVLVSWLAGHGARRAAIDSSGNAGSSLAAYCARAGVECVVYSPARTSPAKVTQIYAYGAEVVLVPGPRRAVADAAMAAHGGHTTYASHMWNPHFLLGTQTFAFELWEQLGSMAPRNIVLPLGAGTLLLGAYRGFEALRSAGLIPELPSIFGVQSAACAPMAQAWAAGREDIEPITAGPSIAEGILLPSPPRTRETLAAVRTSGGAIVSVDDDAIWEALLALGRGGVYAEPTSAAALAGLKAIVELGFELGPPTVVALTGNGLKATAMVAERMGKPGL